MAAATPAGHAVGSPQACSAATRAAGSSNYTSTQLADAYGLSQLLDEGRTGAGQTIGVIEFEQFSNSDISAFENCYGLNNPTRVVTVDATPTGSSSGSGEAALDIELAAVSAPSASLVVYEAPNNIDVAAIDLYNRIAAEDVAQVVSTSWGFCEQDNDAGAAAQENAIFQRMAMQGQTMVAASGDSGSEDCFGADGRTQLAVDDPGSQPDVVSAGGTTLIGGATASQAVWNNCLSQSFGTCQQASVNGAGGGGFSAVWPRSSWQPVLMSAPNERVVPDLSLDADPHHGVVIYWGGWLDFGGTSAVAPSLAGFLADTNQGCNSRVGLVGPALYAASSADEFHRRHDGEQRLHRYEWWRVRRLERLQSGDGSGHAPGAESRDCLAGRRRLPRDRRASAPARARSRAPVPSRSEGAAWPTPPSVTFGAAGVGTIESTSATSLVVVPPSPGRALCVNITVTNPQGTSVVTSDTSFAFGVPGCGGYRFVGSDGGVFDFGNAPFEGSTGNLTLQKPIVGMAATPTGNGYWLVASDGGIFASATPPSSARRAQRTSTSPSSAWRRRPTARATGWWRPTAASSPSATPSSTAPPVPSTSTSPSSAWRRRPTAGATGWSPPTAASSPSATPSSTAPPAPSTSTSPSSAWRRRPTAGGYWLVASDGGIFAFGDAQFYGSTGAIHLNQPIVGMAATPSGGGYWLVASDGGIFTFGDAQFFGSTGDIHLNRPIVGIADA